MSDGLIATLGDAPEPDLRDALNVAGVGIVLLDADLRVRMVNQRFVQMFQPSASVLAATPGFRDLLECAGRRSWFTVPDSDLPDYYDRRVAEVRAGPVAPSAVDLHDGRRLLFSAAVCADGGRILTYTDMSQALLREARQITERLQAEQQFHSETMAEQAAYLVTVAESADEGRRTIEATQLLLEQQISEHARLEADLVQLASTDGLTGALNRSGFLAKVDRIMNQPCQSGHLEVVMMLDVDHFKAINDRFGHAGGDHALKHLVSTVTGETRANDLVGRLGGEEFAILLQDATPLVAGQVAERLRSRVSQSPLPFGDQMIDMTVSIGLAIRCDPDESLDELLARADDALYTAKRGGRNRVVMHRHGPVP